MAEQVIWYGVVSTGKDPPLAHARLVTEKGMAERPLCGQLYEWSAPREERGRCRRCEDIVRVRRIWNAQSH
jgi:hypothetical protein